MPSDRTQRRIDALLDQADEATDRGDWIQVAEKARAVLAMDPENEDAPALLRAAEANLGPSATPIPRPPSTEPAQSAVPSQPDSFAGGRYQVRRFLGEGGKKRVFLAHDELLDRDVAFAQIKTDDLDDIGRERILREAQAMGRMGTHPHIVSIFDFGEEQGAPYVVTELMGGGDVEGLLEQADGPLPIERTLELGKAVARGLLFAHAQGVVHRDLKPGNVWLTSDGVAKIGDFGLAVTEGRSRLTQHGMMVGTYGYMPPEQALGGEATPQSDLYSLGCMLYELVTGKTPFQGDSPIAVITQHLNTAPVAPSWHTDACPPAIEDLILQLMAKVAPDRPASAQAVLELLERADPEARGRSHSGESANPLERLAHGVFVGRERELESLRTGLEDALAGHGSVVMLVGEPGIGKTRVAQELETYARMRGAKVLWGRAHESVGAPPYFPWVQVARMYREQTNDDVRRRLYEPYAADLQRIFPGLHDLFPGLPEPPAIDSEEGQFRLFDSFASVLRAASAETPLVIVLDDLHWADRPTLGLLAHLAREIAHARLLVVGTYRDTDLDRQHPLSRALAELNREQLFTRINLHGLTQEEVGAYVSATAQVEPPLRLVARVHEETEGNPFFLSEVVNLMAQEGQLGAGSVSDIAIPEGVKEALGRRLDRLSAEANELLSLAAVLGRESNHDQLVAISGKDDEELLRLVEEALAGRVLEESGRAGGYRFTHALMQETLLGELSAARRVRLHGQIAQALDELYGDGGDEHAPELAQHYVEASALDRSHATKAVRYAELAARQAEAVAAWEEAAEWYEHAIAGLKDRSGEDGHVGDLWMSLSFCMRAAGRLGDGAAAFDQGVEAYRRHTDPGMLAAGVARGLSGEISITDLVALRGVIREALDGLGDVPSEDACSLLALLAVSDRYPSGDIFAERARSMAATLGLSGASWPYRLEHRELVCSLSGGDWERSAAIAEELHLELVALGSQVPSAQAALALVGACSALFWAGEIERAQQVANRMAAFANERRLPTTKDVAALYSAQFALARNEPVGLSTEERPFRLSVGLAADALSRGDIERAARLLPADDHPGRMLDDSWFLTVQLLLALNEDDRVAASQLYTEWRKAIDPSRLSAPIWELEFLVGGHAALLKLGDSASLDAAYRTLVGQQWFRLSHLCEAADVARGALALRLGKIDAAAEHYKEGLAWARRSDVRFGFVEARCLLGLADVAGLQGDDLAMDHLDAAGELFSRYGAKFYLDQVIAKKQILKA